MMLWTLARHSPIAVGSFIVAFVVGYRYRSRCAGPFGSRRRNRQTKSDRRPHCILEARLRTEIESVAVLNAGIISYSPFLSKLLFQERLTKYEPTLVMLFLDATDIGDDYRYSNDATVSDDGIIFPFDEGVPERYRGALYELARPYHRRLMSALRYPMDLLQEWAGLRSRRTTEPRDYYGIQIAVGGVLENNRFFIYRHSLNETRPFFDATMRHIDEIAALASKINAQFVLAITPRFHHWNVEECPNNWEKDEYGRHEPHQFEYFRYFDEARRDFAIINLLPDFQATRRYPLVFAGDPHWNADGHQFVADIVRRHLLAPNLLGLAVSASQR